VDAVCTVCRSHLAIGVAQVCDECDQVICPVCGSHGTLALRGEWVVPLEHAASVRASVWGRAN
jgi:hypothetical protein